MGWSYDNTKLSESKLFQLRFELGDTNPESPVFEDEEMLYILSIHGENVKAALVGCLEQLIGKFAYIPNFKLGPYSEDRTAMFEWLQKRLEDAKSALAAHSGPIMYKPEACKYFYEGMMKHPDWRG